VQQRFSPPHIPGGPIKFQQIGTWSDSAGLAVPHPVMFDRRTDLSGVTLVNTVLTWAPVSIVKSENDTRVVSGLIMGLVEILQDVSMRQRRV
jgi:hypothetical protein